MMINDEVKAVIEGAPFITLVTVSADGTPHPIIAGKGEVSGDQVIFGIYKMEVTQKNLQANDKAWLVGATKDGGPKGYRLFGTAKAVGKQLIFTAQTVEAMI